MFTENVMWLLGSYLAGSFATYFLMLKHTYIDASGKTIDTLVEGGFLRTRRMPDGELEILKWNDFSDPKDDKESE